MRSSIFAALLTLGLFAPSLAAADSPAFDLGIGTWYADLPDFAYATDATGGPLWFSPVDDAGWIANGELTMRFGTNSWTATLRLFFPGLCKLGCKNLMPLT